MINLENHMLSQKLSWIKRLLNSSHAPWTKLCTKSIDPEKLYTLGPMWSEQLVKRISNPFWKEVILAWNKLASKIDLENLEKLTCPLWYNPKISREPLYLPHWFRAGIITPADLINADGNILSPLELSKQYKVKSNFLEYSRVQRCLKKFLQGVELRVSVHERPICPLYLKSLSGPAKCSKQFYDILNVQYDNNSLRLKWSGILGTNINEVQWKKFLDPVSKL